MVSQEIVHLALREHFSSEILPRVGPKHPHQAALVFASSLAMMDGEIMSHEIQLENMSKESLFDPFEFVLRT